MKKTIQIDILDKAMIFHEKEAKELSLSFDKHVSQILEDEYISEADEGEGR